MTTSKPYDPHNPNADPLPVNTPTPIDGQVILVEYDPEWPAMFHEQTDRIREALDDRALLVEHVGSTSVPGLVAKPCIDILLSVADAGDDAAWSPDLERAGYVLRHRELFHGEPHRVFNAPDMNVNLHVLSQGSPESARLLGFRDWLRSHPEDADRYADAKRELAARHWRTMQDYADAKDDVVREISERMRKAMADEG
jgi:GrpB-like predicted nucleotidyltransferase (UPF0157 family)